MYVRAARTIDAMPDVFVVRQATAADAAVIARHRAQMFRDMAQPPAIDRLVLHALEEGRVLYELLGFSASGEMRYAKALR